MITDRAFNRAIIFSAIWHLFWISVVGIVVTPTVQTSDLYQEVDFLGPILEKTAFDLMVEEVAPQAETLYARSAFFQDKVYLKPRGPKRKVLKEFMPSAALDRLKPYLRDYAKAAKETPRLVDEALRVPYEKPRRRKALFIEGPAGRREIVFKPKLLTVPRGIYGDAEEYRVRLKFLISTDGSVYNARPVVSSGYPEIDLRAIRFLKCWRFSPLSFVEKEKSAAWGVVTINARTR